MFNCKLVNINVIVRSSDCHPNDRLIDPLGPGSCDRAGLGLSPIHDYCIGKIILLYIILYVQA